MSKKDKYNNVNLSVSMDYRLKDTFLEFCNQNDLTPSKVTRRLVEDFLSDRGVQVDYSEEG